MRSRSTTCPRPGANGPASLAHRYRRCLLAHRDGAVIVAGTYAAESGTLRFTDAMIAALLDGGLDERHASWVFWTIQYLTLGLAQEEQALAAQDGVHTLGPALAGGDYPALARVAPHLEDAAFTERFEFGLSRILSPSGPTAP